ncbi:hypothetical protein Pla52n_38270 [Stieleria varia]|uniref:Uncharacterized protein n=1 Tax=Stieleria varia TaxID=2528005 RepID=A0A5C6AT83_9BACT|nr:hypothetical protein Pla52n_38270 [Stieleria varia]
MQRINPLNVGPNKAERFSSNSLSIGNVCQEFEESKNSGQTNLDDSFEVTVVQFVSGDLLGRRQAPRKLYCVTGNRHSD